MDSHRTSEKSLVLDKAPEKSPVFIYVVTFMSAIGGFLFGYDTGVVSGAIILLRDYFSLNYKWQEVVVSVTIVSAWFFALVSGIANDKFGRKSVIIFASCVFTIGALLMGFAVSTEQLIGGRFVVGAGIGFASMTVPTYIGEVAPSNIRGRLVTINQCCITLGQLIACIVSGIFSGDAERGWRYMLGLAAVPSVIQFFGFLFMPESPRWLIMRKRYDQALLVLRKIRSGPDSKVEEEFQSIKSNCLEIEQANMENNDNSPVLIRVLKNPNLRRALLIGCSLQIIQQLCGINTVMYYSATIIQMSGVKDNTKVIWLSCATAGMNCICSLIALFLIERVGRRILTLVSLAGVIVSLCFLAVTFQVADMNSPNVTIHTDSHFESTCSSYSTCSSCVQNDNCGFCFEDTPGGPMNSTCLLRNVNHPEVSQHGACNSTHHATPDITWANNWCPSPYSWLTLLALLTYLLSFAPGMGPTPWAINAEIYPMWARGTCNSTATSFNWLSNFFVSLTFLSLTQELTKYGAFYLYAAISAVSFIFLFFMLPETRGKTLEEVESIFSQSWWNRKANERQTVQPNEKSSHQVVLSKKVLSEMCDQLRTN